MTYKMGPKGQVVIPKEIRDHLGLQPGDELNVIEGEGEVRIRKAGSVRDLIGVLGDGALTAKLEADRREDREREERKAAEWGVGRS